MSYSENFPSIRPSFQFNADAGRLDSRISYSRSTTGSFYGKDKHLSSDNLLTYSENFGAWSQVGLFSRTGGQTDPAGGSTGFTLRENSSSGYHRNYLNAQANESFAFVVYAKQNSGTRYLCLTLLDTGNDWESAIFDLAGGAPTTVSGSSSGFTNVSATQTASGNGYYKCVLKATGYTNTANVSIHNSTTSAGINTSVGLPSYTGDGSSSIDVAFASLSSTGATDYNATTAQIHREYAPTLQTAAINAPRFEYSPTDSASMGLLIEGSSTNLYPYGSDQSNWSGARRLFQSNAAISPAGTLTADLVTLNDDDANTHYVFQYVSVTSGTTYTISQYVKAAGLNYIALRPNTGFASNYVYFDVSNGTVISNTGGLGATIDSVGDGWYRVSVTATANATVSNATCAIYYMESSSSLVTATGDSYRGILLWGAQWEASSFASSLVDTGTSSSTVTRASDSASMVDANLFDNGEGALFVENKQPNATQNNAVVSITDGGSSNYVRIRGNFGNFRGEVYNNAAIQADLFGGTNDTNFHKQCITFGNNNVSFYVDGNEKGSTDTTGVIPELNTIRLGYAPVTGNGNQHIRRVAVYGSQISETEAAAITS